MALQRISKMSAYICFLVLSLASIAYLCHNLNVPGNYMSRLYQSEHIYTKVDSLRSLKTPLSRNYFILRYCKSLRRSRESAKFLELLLLGKALTHESRFTERTIIRPSATDIYFKTGSEFLGISMLHSVLTIVFLTGFLSINISKKVPKDLYNFEDLDKEGQASLSKGTLQWKLVMGDAFREPSFSKLLCVMVGNGIQIAGTAVATITLEVLGFISPKSEAMLLTVTMCFCLSFGFVAGYVGVWLWRNIKGSSEGWRSLCWSIACLFITSFCILIALNPCSQFRALSWFLSVTAGVFPFTMIFVELFFVFPLIWDGRSYYDFSFLSEKLVGLLLMAAIFLTVACAEVSVGSAYMCLCTRDWKWWWKAFFASGSVGFYIFMFSINYLAFDIGGLGRPASVALYLGYSVILAFAVMLSTGAVGFLTAFCFIRYLALLQ
ncbi:transmembrane 9 superfamily member 12-like [Elaeis guineensis]|uniref:transmembrane 9 superfamily member 12-like n=1 Tax=Elaeis guineensis var. tenera TaxID=51953 RepID=UPI003C6D4EC2